MIEALVIDDFAALRHLELGFGPGLNVLSGASGQGKSTVLEALRFVSGLGRGKGLGRLVRRGSKAARVSLTFRIDPTRLHDMGKPWVERAKAGSLTVTRSVDTRGRSRAEVRVNGGDPEPLAAGELREVGQRLSEIYGQGSAPRLVDEAVQRDLLDQAGRSLGKREAYAAQRQGLYALAAERDALEAQLAARVADEESELDVRATLEGLDPEPREYEELVEREEGLSEVSTWLEGLGELGTLFNGPGAAWVQRLERIANRLEADPDDPVLAPLTEGLNLLELSRGALDERLEALEDQRAELEEIRERLRAFRAAARSVRAAPEQLAARWAALNDAPSVAELGVRLRKHDKALAEAWQRAVAAGTALSAARAQAATQLERAIAPRLQDLGLGRGRVRIRVEPTTAEAPAWTQFSPPSVHPAGSPSPGGAVAEAEQHLPTAHGLDFVAFEFSPDSAVELAPLAQASGGELSRLFLALGERAAGDAPVLVFDEIDQNLGARLGSSVGACLADLGQGRQVLVVTHLAPVAARAALHQSIQRREGEVVATVLEGAARVEELALMIRGDPVTPAAREQAEELLREAPRGPVAQPKRGRKRRRMQSA
ncbi:MAG: AAA family ATPase [Planctomycetota bacterium]